MDFQTTTTTSVPKNLYPCLATITVVPQGTDLKRRISTSSFGSNEGDGGGLTRVISGNRRRTSFGPAVDRTDGDDTGRRRSFGAGGGLSGSAVAGDEVTGKWYWRVQAGATDNQLVLLPLTSPPNPVLTSPPQPLSHAMPAHSSAVEHRGHGDTVHDERGGLGAKIKNFFRRGSTSHEKHGATQDTAEVATHATTGDVTNTTSPATSTTGTAVDKIVDQTAQGEMLPSASANAVGATNVNANAETGWPGVINGQHLAGIVVDLHAVDKNRVTLGGGKKNEGSTVTVYVSGFGNTPDVGRNNFEQLKSGVIKFEFDKDWIGAKGEAELLHHHITTAIENLGERALPDAPNFRLGGDGF